MNKHKIVRTGPNGLGQIGDGELPTETVASRLVCVVRPPGDGKDYHHPPDGSSVLVLITSGTITFGVMDADGKEVTVTLGAGDSIRFEDWKPRDGVQVPADRKPGHFSRVGSEGATQAAIFIPAPVTRQDDDQREPAGDGAPMGC